MTTENDSEIEQLTQGQIDCLLLVHQHLTSKEIGLQLGISPHTVDQRIRVAMRTLGCKRRAQAAQLVASSRGQEPVFLLRPNMAELLIEHQAKLFEGKSRKSIALPFATRDHPNNEMSIPLRLLWIVVIAFGSSFSAGMYLAGLESLARLIQS